MCPPHGVLCVASKVSPATVQFQTSTTSQPVNSATIAPHKLMLLYLMYILICIIYYVSVILF
jgi:hypothetical protein